MNMDDHKEAHVAAQNINEKEVDVAFSLAAELDSGYVLTKEMDRKVLWKIDLILLPLISITATISFLDKVSNNYANLFGLSTDLGMVGTEFSWSASIFYFAFLIAQPIVSVIAQKVPLGKLISVACFCWGAIILGEGFVKTYGGFMALRFFQGVFESVLLPSFLLMTSMWWKRSEQSFRAAFWFNSVAGILGGLFAYAIGHINGSLNLYSYINIIYGGVSMFWGVLLFFALPDTPVNAWFLNKEERLAAVARLKDNGTGINNRVFKWDQFWEAVLDIKTWGFFFFALSVNIPNGGLNAFSTTIIKNFGFGTLQTDLLAVPFGVVATGANLLIGVLISFFPSGYRFYLIAAVAVIPLIGEVVQFTVTAQGPALMGYYFTGAFNAPYVMMLGVVSSNTAGATKRTVTNGIIWIAYCAGNIIGPFCFISSQAPKYRGGVAALLICFIFQIVAALCFRFYFVHLNKQRDRRQIETGEVYNESAEYAFSDLTDKQNPAFRYMF